MDFYTEDWFETAKNDLEAAVKAIAEMVSVLTAGSNDKYWLKTIKDNLESATWEVAEGVVEKYTSKVGEEKAKEAVEKTANWCLEVMNNALEVVWNELLEN